MVYLLIRIIECKVGDRVILEGEDIDQEKQAQLNPKKGMMEKCLAECKTDSNGVC